MPYPKQENLNLVGGERLPEPTPPPRFWGATPNLGLDKASNSGYLIEMPYGWILVTSRHKTRAILRKDHGWTSQTAEEALMIQEGDVLV